MKGVPQVCKTDKLAELYFCERQRVCKQLAPVLSRLRPLMSCRKEMSPMSSVVARLRPKAKPAAVLMMPSIPLAPRLAAMGAPSP